jgi:arginine decarboxylase
MDHSRAPVLDALVDFRRRGDVAVGPPGHRQGRGVDPRVLDVLGVDLFRDDVLTLNGLDDRRQSHGIVEQAQELMADAVGADKAFFSTCGSSLSVKTAILAVAGPGEQLLVSRNAHKSVVSGLILSGVRPVWVHPRVDTERHLVHPPEPADVERALRDNPGAKGMLLISPTDWGTCADIAGVTDVCHAAGVPSVVDEAWGAHLPFHEDLPQWGMNVGADLVVTSVHKMGAAVEQSSVFHLQGSRIDPTLLKQRADILATTSASSLVFATLDGWRRQMVERGHELLDVALARALRIRAALGDVPGLEVMGDEVVRAGLVAEIDPLVVVVDVRGLGITGFQASEWLRTTCHLDMSASDSCRITAHLSIGDDDRTEELLVGSLQRLAAAAPGFEPAPPVAFPSEHGLELESVMTPREAFFAQTEDVPVDQAVGRIAAEIVSPYPPGVPVLAPGERITAEVLEYLRSGVAAGLVLPDPASASLDTVRVVR